MKIHPFRNLFHCGKPTPFCNPSGNVIVVVALLMTLLLGILSFVLDSGYLHLKRNQYQNAVEAAAMAGALDLCGDYTVTTTRRIAAENGIGEAFDDSILQISPGYYDENDTYPDDFSVYQNFEADPNPETPRNEAVPKADGTCCQYNNAVLVLFEKTVQPLIGTLRKNNSPVVIRAAAVGYLKRYGMVALGDDGITTSGVWMSGYPAYRDQNIHANSRIVFGGYESFQGDTLVTAVEGISAGEGITDVDPVELPPIDWEGLEEDARDNGRIYDPSQWPEGDPNEKEDWHADDRGNEYLRRGSAFFFCPADGDFDGATYLFRKNDEGEPGSLVIVNEQQWRTAHVCRRLTIASELDVKIGNFSGGHYNKLVLTFGEPGPEAVRLYAKGDILFRDRYASFSPVAYQCGGLVMIGEKKVTIQTSMHTYNSDHGHHRLRIIADSIAVESQASGAVSRSRILLDGLFAPPCPPRLVKLGRLVYSQ